jgi:hypothetical protein
VNLLGLGITARDIMTKKAFENAIAVTESRNPILTRRDTLSAPKRLGRVSRVS